ncbi:hypothetical protein U1701_18295, partial [Sphingomonas sp. PB2P19]|uniref:hypothetical protein n=1 Tax=Sphingomonas rhamnosi TaxID=3096156 RepID=UPI002FC964D2
MADDTKPAPRKWLVVLLSLAALLALGFAIYALIVSWRVTRSGDAKHVRELAIAASNIEGWPELPPSEWSIDYKGLDQGRDDECLRRSTSPRRSSGSCVK